MESMQIQEDLVRERREAVKALGDIVMSNYSGAGIGRQKTEEGSVICLVLNGFVEYSEEAKEQIRQVAAPVPVTFGFTGQTKAY